MLPCNAFATQRSVLQHSAAHCTARRTAPRCNAVGNAARCGRLMEKLRNHRFSMIVLGATELSSFFVFKSCVALNP